MDHLREVVKDHAFNKDQTFQRVTAGQATNRCARRAMVQLKRLIPAGVAAVLVLIGLGSAFLLPAARPEDTSGIARGMPSVTTLAQPHEAVVSAAAKMASSACAIVTVDINPSFSIQVNSTQQVISIHATNADARSLYAAHAGELDRFTGRPVAEAVARIIQLAREAGYLPETSSDAAEAKYVLVTTAILDADQDGTVDDAEASAIDKDEVRSQQEAIGQKIQAAVQAALDADPAAIRVAVIKATLRDVRAAEQAKIPLGLFIVKGYSVDTNGDQKVTAADGEPVKVADLVRNPEALARLQERATLIEGNRNLGQAKKETRPAGKKASSDD
jgi:hypothetical protein